MGIYGSSGRRADPLSHIGLVVGIVGAVLSGLLWWYRFDPDSTLLGSYSLRFTEETFHDQVRILTAALGLMAVIAGIGASVGGRGRASSAVGLVLGVFALSYPVLSYMNVISRSFGSPV